jgi:hypothetical protein
VLTPTVRATVLVLAFLAPLAAGACAPADLARGDPVIDTWPVGEPLDCAEVRSCDELVAVGLAGLDDRDPGHAPVVETHLRREGAFVDPTTGEQIRFIRSGGCCHVLVLELADRSTRAIGVGYPGISKTAVAIPWEAAPRR